MRRFSFLPEPSWNRARRTELIGAVAKLFMEHGPGATRTKEAAQLAAELVHAIYLSASREWLESSAPDPRIGMRRFDALLKSAERGFDPASVLQAAGCSAVGSNVSQPTKARLHPCRIEAILRRRDGKFPLWETNFAASPIS